VCGCLLRLVQTSQQVEAGDWASKALPKPHEIRAALDQYVIGQDVAKKHYLLRFITIISV
jgi:ATP-dependent Clp protease ATP-binding subunit ClpX